MKPHLLPFLFVFLLTACQMHGLRLDEDEVNSTSLEDLLKGQGLDEAKTKEQMERSQESLLRHAAEKGWLTVVHKLLLQREPVDSRNQYDRSTPLHKAAEKGHTDIVKLLIEKGAALDSKDIWSRIPLHVAAEWGHTEVAALLLSYGADLTTQDSRGDTALQRAQSNNKTETAAFLELAVSKSKEWLEGYYKGFSWEKDKGEKKAHAYAKAYAKAFSKAKKNNAEEWCDAYHREFLGQKQQGKSRKKSHAYAKVYADAYVKAKTHENFQAAEKLSERGDIYASYYAKFIAQGKSHKAADGLAYASAME